MDIAQELYTRIAWLADNQAREPRLLRLYMHETLVLLCHEATEGRRLAFGTLFAQVDYLCRLHHLSPSDTAEVQRMRRDSNAQTDSSSRDNVGKNAYAPSHRPCAAGEARRVLSSLPALLYDCRALALLTSAVTKTAVPGSLRAKLPSTARPTERKAHIDFRALRCVVTEPATGGRFTVRTEPTAETRRVNVSPDDAYLLRTTPEGATLSLIDVHEEADHTLTPRLIVVEPDYLLDISSIARLFQDWGHHPLAYIVNALTPSANSQAILLGNYAGDLLDAALRHDADEPLAAPLWATTLRRHFAADALSYATCPEFKQDEYKELCRQQAENIEAIVEEIKREYGPGTTSASTSTDNGNQSPSVRRVSGECQYLLEPSFLCPALGLQGRVDLMTSDMRLLVEQKSGKNRNIERHIAGPHGALQQEAHYVQLLLYYAVLRQNFNLAPSRLDIRLMYSRYPLPDGLLAVNYYHALLHEAITVRNRVASSVLYFARNGFTPAFLHRLMPETISIPERRNSFYYDYIYPEQQQNLAPLHALSQLEELYFCRLASFIFREQAIAALGAVEGTTHGMADIWNMTLEQKIAQGATIVCRDDSGAQVSNLRNAVTLPRDSDRETDFRPGDSVFIYPFDDGETPDATRAILYKGFLRTITSQSVTIALADPQPLPAFSPSRRWAVEHGYSSSGLTAGLHALYMFAVAKKPRRDLLLTLTTPRRDTRRTLSQSYHKDYDDVVLAARQALDYYLLVGPPGTGKTSMAMQFMVREHLAQSPENTLLLTSYTNRAVDEICSMLTSAGLDFLRIGNPFTCDTAYHERLAVRRFRDAATLADVRSIIETTRIVVATTSTLMAHQEIFELRTFTLTIVDEASQILEPGLVGLLSILGKFILVGDHKQLPAVVQQPEADSAVVEPELRAIGLTDCRRSLFERLLSYARHAAPGIVGTLHTQGRMHPVVAEWPSRMFYRDEQLRPVPLPHQKETTLGYAPQAQPPHDGDWGRRHSCLRDEERRQDCLRPQSPGVPGSAVLALPLSSPLIENRLLFYNVTPAQGEADTKSNAAEARIVATIIERLHMLLADRYHPTKSIGVIVPYRNQISLIRRETAARLGTELAEALTIDTVERYQGSQRDIIIFSTTVTQPHQLRFLTSNTFLCEGADGSHYPVDRKLNVALTRARKQMILVGSRQLLEQNPLFASLISSCKQVEI